MMIANTDMVQRIRRGDKAMEEAFCRQYYRSVLALLRFYTRDEATAEDITHDALIKVLVRLRDQGIDKPESLSSFVHQTARFTFLGWSRLSDNRLQLFESMDDKSIGETDLEGALLNTEKQQILAHLIECMTVARDRELLLRCYLGDEQKIVVCESLKLTADHFDRVISRARKRLKAIVSEQAEEIVEALEVMA